MLKSLDHCVMSNHPICFYSFKQTKNQQCPKKQSLYLIKFQYIYLTDLEQLLSAAKVPVQVLEKGVLVLSVRLIVVAKTEWGNTGKKTQREFLQLRNNLVNSEKPVLLQRRILNTSLQVKKKLINIPSSFSFPGYYVLKGSYMLEVNSALESTLC